MVRAAWMSKGVVGEGVGGGGMGMERMEGPGGGRRVVVKVGGGGSGGGMVVGGEGGGGSYVYGYDCIRSSSFRESFGL